MKKSLLLVAVMMLLSTAAMAQVGIGNPVPLQEPAPGNVPPIPDALEQGTRVVGDPANGVYDILINGWIEAYARVSAYDNWIDFGIMSPTSGSYAAPARRWAFSENGEALYALAGEDGGQNPLYEVNGSTTNFDLAGIQIQTNARLDLVMDFGGYMRRCDDQGDYYTANDPRRADSYYYQLRNQAKMVFHGRFLESDGFIGTDPGVEDDGTQYKSPTSGQLTDYNDWTNWGAGVNAINNEDGWFEPSSTNDPWTGLASFATDGGRDQLPALNLVVERGQAQTTGTGEAAEIWWTQRILRRGLQDVAGNYRADMFITLTYREADARWNPAVK